MMKPTRAHIENMIAKKEFVRGLVAGGSPVRKIAFHPNGNFAVSLNGSAVVVWQRKK